MIILRWYGIPPGCDVLFIEIKNKTKYNFINTVFPKIDI